jgi:competence protein ComEC
VKNAFQPTMRDLTDRPLVCLALSFTAGIALGARWGIATCWVLTTLSVIGVLMWALLRSSALVGLSLVFLSMGSGVLLLHLSERQNASDVSRLSAGGQTLVGTVANAPAYFDGNWRFVLSVEAHEHAGKSESVAGRVFVRMRSSFPIKRGEEWRLTGKLRPLRRVGNPGQRTEADRLASLGVTAVLRSDEGMAEKLGDGKLSWLARHAFRAQQAALTALARKVGAPYPETTANVAASVIFGVHATPPPAAISEAFRRAGTIHLLVVSGAMISMVFGLVFLPGLIGASWRRTSLERQFGWPTRYRGKVTFRPGLWAALIAIAAVTYYALLTEGGQAVVRAAVMGIFTAFALVLRRMPAFSREHGLNSDPLTLLAAAAMVVLVGSPNTLFQPGFQLSFTAVAAIIYLTPRMHWLLNFLPKWLGYALLGAVIAQIALLPILAWHFGQIPLVGFLSNLLAIPLASVTLVAGMATCGLAVIVPWAAPLAGWVTGWSTRWLIWVSSAFASLPYASISIIRPPVVLIVLWYLSLLILGSWLGQIGKDREIAKT